MKPCAHSSCTEQTLDEQDLCPFCEPQQLVCLYCGELAERARVPLGFGRPQQADNTHSITTRARLPFVPEMVIVSCGNLRLSAVEFSGDGQPYELEEQSAHRYLVHGGDRAATDFRLTVQTEKPEPLAATVGAIGTIERKLLGMNRACAHELCNAYTFPWCELCALCAPYDGQARCEHCGAI